MHIARRRIRWIDREINGAQPHCDTECHVAGLVDGETARPQRTLLAAVVALPPPRPSLARPLW